AGKSTLFKLISGEYEPDSGSIARRNGLRVSQLPQSLPEDLDRSVFDYVGDGLAELRGFIHDYEQIARQADADRRLRELETLQKQIDAQGGWDVERRIQTMLSELDLPAERRLSSLSGGWRRRVGLARAIVSNPDLLLLDEPTNHLDLSTIEWLEQRIAGFAGSILFVTHDRAFLQRLATRIIELDRGKLVSWPGSYQRFLVEKERWMEEETRRNALFDKRLAQEESWIRQGIKARRTRNEGRVRALQAMREVYAQRLKAEGKARIHVEQAEQSGRRVIEARNLVHGYEQTPLIDNFSIKIMRGDRIGLVGNNGVGKSTLLRLLLGEIEPQAGSVKLGTNLQVGYFDQLRRELDPDKTVAEVVGDGRDHVFLNGKPRHVVGYLRGFLFSAERALTKIRSLSGGECNRVILARLFTRASNLLVLDEPTNDLDIETLEVLEQQLCDYDGTLLVVSHDREFLDNVVTSILVFETGGRIEQYVGGYSDWLRRGRQLAEMDNPDAARGRGGTRARSAPDARQDAPDPRPAVTRPGGGKLSYKLKFELEQLPDRIEALEGEIAALSERSSAAGFYDQPYEAVSQVLDALAAKQQELDRLMARWDELETLQNDPA
ncbi:MAG: ATP-binding cassette domain-containing protein, partial [Gammaproteobacteria bacterium]|nr:ATP-binding cassette domain-containing protein [Gammaproteobacteria bacterium]